MDKRRRAHDLGSRAEEAAARAYRQLGFRVIERNWRCRRGEIDLVARRGSLLAIVEVKARCRDDYGTPAEAVHVEKRRRIVEAAREYVARLAPEASPLDVRFDVVTVRPTPHGGLEVECWTGAFDAF